ncbi:MAG: enoyl-CoA hydratase [Xanthomonadales bacterium]|nr:enoyl-CoA hydratase [Xanthomonadales bacterium]NIN58283.1 enoyl-CoA hydratase [Xanthomonadales bacterium]NIN73628.1 enoyl-CoA hydratase [Xanthomonadales bacterium]NIO14413.1 enoyl-CoA hydratase [Xanthomonadales bacterium]NIP10676.1 enoyl-CoA hydratase [Xanthomonadales bacterium]
MTEQRVLCDLEQGVFQVTINNPEKLNALDSAIIGALEEAFRRATDDPEVRAVVLTGAGPKAFVAGADITELQVLDPSRVEPFVQRAHRLMDGIESCGKPVIAAVNGYALGGGLELAMACHLRIASSTALLGLPEVKLALLPGYGGTQRLPRLVGRGKALMMMLTGEPVTAAEALASGLVNRVVEPDELEATVQQLARKLANSAPIALRAILDAVLRGGEMPGPEGLAHERRWFVDICATEDMREGTAAFVEKRKAQFRGR